MNAKTPHNGGASNNHTHAIPTAGAHVLADDDRDPSRLAYEQAESRDDAGETARAILTLLAEHGPIVDDDLHQLYVGAGYPPRSPQRIRTARAALVRAGKVRQAGRGLSQYGNPARLWEVAA